MSEMTDRNNTRIDPDVAWTVVTESPLKGLAFAREAGRILAWDEGNQLYLLTTHGETMSSSRAPSRVLSGAISDDGSLIALLCEHENTGLLLMSGDFEIVSERPAPGEASFVTTDPHGRYVAVGSRLGAVTLVNRHGRAAGRIETIQAIAHLCFVPDRPFIVGAAAFGMLAGVELEASKTPGRLDPEVVWQDRLMSNVGRLTVSGDGSMILASCFTHGIQRFDLNGRNEGSYHLGGTVSHAIPDFPGRSIAAATLEGELAIMNSAGNVRWRTRLARPVIALEIDPLGRYVIHGSSTGEITRLDLFGPAPGRPTTPQPTRTLGSDRPKTRGGGAGSVRQPDWAVPAVQTEDQAETAVLTVCDDPPCAAVFSSPRRLAIYDATGQTIAQGPDITGVGRILRTAPGWLAAATDRQIMLCDLRRNTQKRLDLSLVELTHLVIKPDSFGLAIVQERDRIGRATPAGRWVWKHELPTPIEDLAVGSEGFAAATTNDGRLLVFDPAGEVKPTAGFDASDPPLLIEAPEGSPPGLAWISLSRRAQQLTGHALKGNAVWTRQLPWEGWSLIRLGGLALIASADGRAMAFDGSGTVRYEGAPTGGSNDVFFLDPDSIPLRVTRKDVHVLCATLDGRVRWRIIGDQPLGPCAASRAGVALMIGTTLAWFDSGGPASEPT
ncbi:hypothetical protein [Paludisphaera borealis]|uniref:Outer membrane protein assembly factor BamB n=1 Tax=Paludisphaera borealis TaxID=1387353 RepID=A0A1U7CKH5_9BACT|nr:hypothetical protein [Paludisphaera borealis]APW59431.1 hypothetical protein BSF38_00854 [Paludisphaera borealis]